MNTNLLKWGVGRSRSGLPPPAVLRAGVLVLIAIVSLLMIACGAGGGGGGGGGAAPPPSANPSTIAKAEVVPPGATCPAGGQTIYYGIDDNGNGVLDEAEQDGSITICNIGLVAITDEPVGTNCIGGGLRVDAGLDNGDNGGIANDGVLQPGESDNHYFICSVGQGEGTVAAFQLIPWERHAGSVAAGGKSYYEFTPDLGDVNRAWIPGLTRTDSDLSWALYVGGTTDLVAACNNFQGEDADEFCVTPVLGDSDTYLLVVEEHSGIPNLFDIQITDEMLLAADTWGRIFRMDTRDGTLSQVADTGIEDLSTGLGNLRSLVYLRDLNSMRVGIDNGNLYSLAPFSSVSTLMDYSVNSPLRAMVADAGGALYAYWNGDGSHLASIDPATGQNLWSMTNLPSNNDSAGVAMLIDGSGLLFIATAGDSTAPDLWWADWDGEEGHWYDLPTTPTTIDFSEDGGFGTAAPRYVKTMAISPTSGTEYAVVVDDQTSVPTAFLVRVFLSTSGSYAEYVATVPLNLTSLVFVSSLDVYCDNP